MQPTPSRSRLPARRLPRDRRVAGRGRGRARPRALRALLRPRLGDGHPPDEVNYTPGVTPPDLTRQLCNLWKADRTIAATTLAARNAELERGWRASRACACSSTTRSGSRPAARRSWPTRTPHTWTASCRRTSPPAGWRSTIRMPTPARSTTPAARTAGSTRHGGTVPRARRLAGFMAEVSPEGAHVDLVPIEVPAGGAAFHDGWTLHGSPPQRARRPRTPLHHQPHAPTRDRVAPDERAPDLQPLPAARSSASWTRPSSPSCGERTATARPDRGALDGRSPRAPGPEPYGDRGALTPARPGAPRAAGARRARRRAHADPRPLAAGDVRDAVGRRPGARDDLDGAERSGAEPGAGPGGSESRTRSPGLGTHSSSMRQGYRRRGGRSNRACYGASRPRATKAAW